MGVVDSFNFEDKLRIEGGVRDVRIQHQFRVFVVALKPNGHFSKFHANPSHECL